MPNLAELFLNSDKHYIYILPVIGLTIPEAYSFGDVSIHPANTLDLNDIFKNTFDMFEERSKKKHVLLSAILSSTTIVVRDDAYAELLFNEGSNTEILRKAIRKARPIVDFIRLNYSSILDKKLMTGRVGQLESGDTVALVTDEYGGLTRIASADIYGNVLNVPHGIELLSASVLDQLSIYKSDINDTGNIVLHAMRLYSGALESSGPTEKFVEFMRIFEFIAFPDDYEKFQRVRAKITQHLARNSYDETRLEAEFRSYTGGTANDGLRTKIIHMGMQLDDLLNAEEINSLLSRLQLYATCCIKDLLRLYNMPWQAVETFRDNNMQAARANKNNEPLHLPSRSVVFIDLDFLLEELADTYDFYEGLYPAKTLREPAIEDIILTCYSNLRIDNPDTLHDFIIYTAYNVLDIAPDTELGFDVGTKRFMGTVKVCSDTQEMYAEINADAQQAFMYLSESGPPQNQIGFVMNDDVLNQQVSVLIMSERRTVNFIKNQNHSHKLLTNFVTASQVLGMLIGVSASEL